MLPFFSALPNQIQPQPQSSSSSSAAGGGVGNNPSLNGQQIMLLNPASLFPPSPMPAASFNNHPPGAVSFPRPTAPLQNNNPMGILPPQFNPGAAAALQLQLQVQLHNAAQLQAQLQSLSALASFQSPVPPGGAFLGPGLPHNFNPGGFTVPNPPVHMQNPMAPGNQPGHAGFPPFAGLKSPQFIVGAGANIAPGNFSNNGMIPNETKENMFQHGGKHKERQTHHSRSPINQWDAKCKEQGHQRSQMSNNKDGERYLPGCIVENSAQGNFPINHHEYGKGVNTRMHKSQFQLAKSPRTFVKAGDKGTKPWRDRKSQFVKCGKPPLVEGKRYLAVNYTENEIRQWIEARKRNFPTRTNIEKKLVRINNSGECVDDDTKLRRQQLKEVLVKQAELGVEVAEIPSNYLSESESQVSLKSDEVKEQNKSDNLPHRYNKRGRYGKENQHAKRPNLRNGPTPALVKQRELTLLQKLLRADIKGDRSRILQVFRFMTLNSFFKNWPDKPLEFLCVTARETGCGDDTAVGESQDGQGITDPGVEKVVVKVTEVPNGYCMLDDAGCLAEDHNSKVKDDKADHQKETTDNDEEQYEKAADSELSLEMD